jgi:hypothetical protein
MSDSGWTGVARTSVTDIAGHAATAAALKVKTGGLLSDPINAAVSSPFDRVAMRQGFASHGG